MRIENGQLDKFYVKEHIQRESVKSCYSPPTRAQRWCELYRQEDHVQQRQYRRAGPLPCSALHTP